MAATQARVERDDARRRKAKVPPSRMWVSRERDLVNLQAARDRALIEYVSRDEACRREVDKILGRKVR